MRKNLVILFLFSSILTFSQEIDFTKFKGQSLSVSLKVKLSDARFTEYFSRKGESDFTIVNINSSFKEGSYENAFLSFYKQNEKASSDINYPSFFYNKSDTVKNYLGLVHSLEFQFQGLETVVLKFFEVKEGVNVGFKVMEFHIINGKWIPFYLKELDEIAYIILHLKTDTFWEFYNKSESKYAIINKVRSQVKDDQGVIYLSRLAELLKLNKTALKDFCDF